ncbi:apolipoprotein N-acyltransferase [Candidatus Erwinia haradaeae]|uniref:Apolipoprotein N-acyltransferase n=1 Tax=Candidatus Erwinia haradaeae TaxID=1922217 RepID=A0A451DA25_9GAMM|nr:apolipoprotein N-acyltransferase [Candidatus Erwinia haradaeae]VFP83131.1 Apolipoprotein N-acyltransferase [Candidatus Erwinia haradaeae]
MIFFNKNCDQWFRLCLAWIVGAIGALSFSPYDYWLALLISFSGLQCLTLNCATRQASIIGFMWGFGFFGTGMYWLCISIDAFSELPAIINLFAMVMLTGYLALYPLIFISLLNTLCTKSLFLRLIVASPVIWHIIEFFRSFVMTGFPWLQFGYTQINGPLKGIAPLMGEEAITFLLVTISGSVVYSIEKRQILAIVFVILLVLLQWPLHSMNWFVSLPERAVDVALVQGNTLPLLKWDPNDLVNILNTYTRLSNPLIGKKSIIIWPESAIPDTEKNQQLFLQDQDQKLRIAGTTLVTGIIDSRFENNNYYTYNTILVIGNGSNPYRYLSNNRYQKNHLVPFGEYVPFKALLQSLTAFFKIPMSMFTQGAYIQPQLRVAGYNMTPALCYEVIFTRKMRDNFRPETDFLLAISNDAWFGDSNGPWQHLQMARMRALELGRPLLYSTNNGVTTIINARGEITHIIPQFESRVLTATVVPTTGLTPYARFGNFGIWVITLLFAVIWLIGFLRLSVCNSTVYHKIS